MASAMAGTLDEAYERLHVTGPEFEGYLSNHGPMVVEAMVRRGHGELVGTWLDVYLRRLDEFPQGMGPIGADWQDALGDVRRVADWTTFFGREIARQPWRDVLNAWWPRLLPPSVPCWRTEKMTPTSPSSPTASLTRRRRSGRRIGDHSPSGRRCIASFAGQV